MVAITVILAAVIGAFVLEIGDQQETAPNTSFDSEEQVEYYVDGMDRPANLTTVSITHAGGDVLDISQVNIGVEGNTSVWGIPEGEDQSDGTQLNTVPQPDLTRTFGSNEQVGFTSGESWEVVAYGAHGDETIDPSSVNYVMAFYDSNGPVIVAQGGANLVGSALQTGDEITVVWEAQSGGKTQSLFKYTAQSDSPDFD
jgi:FlaG/FlaF family flagellin (archaellin)